MFFRKKAIKSFKRIRNDFEALKESTNEWISFLDHQQMDTEHRLKELDRRVTRLEMEKVMLQR